jgi:hypothetical protein
LQRELGNVVLSMRVGVRQHLEQQFHTLTDRGTQRKCIRRDLAVAIQQCRYE